MKKIKHITSVLLILIGSMIHAQLEGDQDISKVGTTAAQFLKISSGFVFFERIRDIFFDLCSFVKLSAIDIKVLMIQKNSRNNRIMFFFQ